MKTRKIFSMLLIILIILTTTVMAYETETFKVTINDNYEQKLEDDLVMFKNTTTGDNIVIQELEQKVSGGKLSSYQLNSISEEITSQYKDMYGAEVEQIGKEEVKINNNNVTKLTFKVTLEGTVIHQELNIFVTKNKIYDIIFTSITESGFTQEEKDSVLNSFEILEVNQALDEVTDIQANNNLWVLIVGLIIIIALVIIIIKNKKSNREQKEKINQNNKKIEENEKTSENDRK